MEKDFTIINLKNEIKDLPDDILVYARDSQGFKCNVPDFYLEQDAGDYIYIATSGDSCYSTVNIKYVKNFIAEHPDSMHLYLLEDSDSEEIRDIKSWGIERTKKKPDEFVICML